MVTFFFMSLVLASLLLASVPVVLFGLMLETCAERAGGALELEPAHRSRSVPAPFQFAAAE